LLLFINAIDFTLYWFDWLMIISLFWHYAIRHYAEFLHIDIIVTPLMPPLTLRHWCHAITLATPRH
jgi:hypothetical protein